MTDHNANEAPAKLPAFIPERPTTFQQHQKRIAQLVSEEMHDGKAWKPEAYSRYNEIENQETVTTPLSQSAERMTAEQLHKSDMTKWWSCDDPVTWEFAEAYAEHCTAALTRELAELKKVGLDNLLSDQEAYDELTKSAESSAALVRELAKLKRYVTHDPKCPEFSQKANRFNEGQVQDSAFPCDCGLESLLSDPAVKKVLEK